MEILKLSLTNIEHELINDGYISFNNRRKITLAKSYI